MDLIESLKRKTEENIEESGAGDDSSEEMGMPAGAETEVGSENPEMPESIDKSVETEVEFENPQMPEYIDMDAEIEVGSENSKLPESGDKNGHIPATDSKTAATRKRMTRNEDGSTKTNVKKGRKSIISNEAEVVRDDSPSSPFHVQIEEDDDFE